jgi:hypothetical protein
VELDKGWATGQNCVADDGNFNYLGGDPENLDLMTTETYSLHGTGIDGWSRETRYYSQYLEDGRVYEGMGTMVTSPAIAYLEEYDPWGWANDSYEAYLAMISGMTIDQVVATLDFMDTVAATPTSTADLVGIHTPGETARNELVADRPEETWQERLARSVREVNSVFGSAFQPLSKRQIAEVL